MSSVVYGISDNRQLIIRSGISQQVSYCASLNQESMGCGPDYHRTNPVKICCGCLSPKLRKALPFWKNFTCSTRPRTLAFSPI